MCILKLTLKLSPWTKCDIDWRGCYNIRWKYKIWPLVNWDIWHPEQIEKIEPASNWECNKAALLFPGCLSRPLHHHLSRAASMLGTRILVGGSRVFLEWYLDRSLSCFVPQDSHHSQVAGSATDIQRWDFVLVTKQGWLLMRPSGHKYIIGWIFTKYLRHDR